MVEKKGLGKAIGHAFLWFGIAIVLFPLYIALVATTHTFDVLIGSTPLWFGGEFLKNFTTVLTQGLKAAGGIPDAVPEWNLIMAVALLGMLPPLLVVLGMQKLFVRGLVETEK